MGMGKSFWAGFGISVFSLAFEGILVVLLLVGAITRENAILWLVIFGIMALIGAGILIWSLCFKKKTETSNQRYEIEKNKHWDEIQNTLLTFKKQLKAMIKSRVLKDSVTKIEKRNFNKLIALNKLKSTTYSNDFNIAMDHCPSVKQEHGKLLEIRMSYDSIINPESEMDDDVFIKVKCNKEQVKQAKESLNNEMRLVIDAIDQSIKVFEYQKNMCDACPNKGIENAKT
jgi:hypothetical protein